MGVQSALRITGNGALALRGRLNKPLLFAAAVLMGTSLAAAGPLHDAVRDDDLARLQQLIAAGEDLSAQDKFVGTALHWAALKDNVDAARLLISAGVDVDVMKVGSQQTPLHIAAERDAAAVAEVLIASGADIEARTAASTDGSLPLHMAAGTDSLDVVKLLIEAGVNIEAHDIDGRTAVIHAAYGNAAGAIELLVAAGAKVDVKLPDGKTALHAAAVYGHVDALKKLIEHGADVNGAPDVEPAFPSSPLASAVVRKMDETADILRQAGASE